MVDASLLLEDGLFVLQTSSRNRDLVAGLGNWKYRKADDSWTAPAVLANALRVRAAFGDGLSVSEDAFAAVREESDRIAVVRAVKNGERQIPTNLEGLDGLFPEQKIASYLASLQGGFFIGDEKGSGKSVEAAGALVLTGAVPALIVCTNSMKYTWKDEIERWTSYRCAVAGRTKAQRIAAIEQVRNGEAEVLVVAWQQLRLHSALAGYGSIRLTDEERAPKELNEIAWQAIIADEAHRCKDPKSKQTRALWKLGETAKYRWPMTATPIKNSLLDLWPVLHFSSPQDWPSKSKFRDRYVLTFEQHWGRGRTSVEELGMNPATEEEFRRIFEPRYIRRKLQLPVKRLPTQHRFVDMEGKQRQVYKALKDESIAKVDDRFLVAIGPLVVNTRLQQAAQATPVVDDEGNVTAMQLPSCKYDALVDLLDEMAGDPLIVFSKSRLLLELCYSELTKEGGRFSPQEVGRVYGGVSSEERNRDINAFQEGKQAVILCSTGAGSEGITLTRSNTIAFLNRDYDQVANDQAEGRSFRIGQKRDVQIIDFIARESEELRVHESNVLKDERMQELVQDEDWERKVVPTEEAY